MKKSLSVLAIMPFMVKGSMPLRVLRYMRSMGHDVSLVYYYSEAVGYTMDLCDDFRSSNSLWNFSGMRSPANHVDLLEIVETQNVNLVLQIGSPFAYQQLAYLKEKRSDIEIVDWLFNEGPHFHAFTRFFSTFSGVLVESQVMHDAVKRISNEILIQVIPSGTSFADEECESVGLREPGAVLRFGYVGRLSPEKNPHGYIRLISDLPTDLAWASFSISGEGPQQMAVRSLLNIQSGLNKVLELDFENDVRVALDRLDCLVLPSVLDGRPGIIMEANARGIPVIASDVGAVRELISEGQNGYIFVSGDSADFLNALEKIRSDYAEIGQKALATKVRNYAVHNFSERKMFENYHESMMKFASKP